MNIIFTIINVICGQFKTEFKIYSSLFALSSAHVKFDLLYWIYYTCYSSYHRPVTFLHCLLSRISPNFFTHSLDFSQCLSSAVDFPGNLPSTLTEFDCDVKIVFSMRCGIGNYSLVRSQLWIQNFDCWTCRNEICYPVIYTYKSVDETSTTSCRHVFHR